MGHRRRLPSIPRIHRTVMKYVTNPLPLVAVARVARVDTMVAASEVTTVAKEAKVDTTVVALVSPIPVAVKSSVTRKITTTPEVVVVVVTIMVTVEAAAVTATVVSAPEAVNTVMARRTVTKSATRTPLAATVAKEAREVATVVLVARDSLVARAVKEAREATTVALSIARSSVTNRNTSPRRNRSAIPVPTASTTVVLTSPCTNHPNNSVVTKTVSSQAALVARAAKVEKVDTTVALVDTTVALVVMAAREVKVAREDTTVAFNNAPSFAKATLAMTTCTGTMKIIPSATVGTRTIGTREDTLAEVAGVVVITPVGVTTITSTIRCRPTNPLKTITSTIRCRPTNPPSVIRPSIVTTTIVATPNKTATKSVNGSVVVSAARAAKAAKEARVATMVVALWVVTMVVMISFTMMTSIAVT